MPPKLPADFPADLKEQRWLNLGRALLDMSRRPRLGGNRRLGLAGGRRQRDRRVQPRHARQGRERLQRLVGLEHRPARIRQCRGRGGLVHGRRRRRGSERARRLDIQRLGIELLLKIRIGRGFIARRLGRLDKSRYRMRAVSGDLEADRI